LHRLPSGHDEDIFAGYAAAGTRPCDGVEIDVMLFREATHSRGGTTTTSAVGVIFGSGWRPQDGRRWRYRWGVGRNRRRLRCGRWCRRGSRGCCSCGGFGCGSRCSVAAADEPKHFAHGDHFTLAPFDARQDAVLLGGNVEVDLVSLQLDQAVTAVDRVALLL